MSDTYLTIGYITQVFPNLTETFIYREVLCLREMGFDLATFAIWTPEVKKLSAESKDLIDGSFYVFPISWPKFLAAHLYFLITRPVKYLRTLFFVLTRQGEKPKNRLRTLFHFGEAIYMATEIKKRGVKHLHAHFSINAASIALIVARLLNISFSFTAHNEFFTDPLILKEKLREAKFIAVISKYSRDYLLQLVPGENLESKFHIVHCGVSLDQFAPRTHQSSDLVPLIFSISQLVERKGLPVLVEACKILAERGVNFECIIAGDGPQRPLLEQLITTNQLQKKVRLVGAIYQEQLSDYLNRTDIFVLPCVTAQNGDRDGIPVVLMEAMAMELPVVSSYVSGIPELIDDGLNGLLVNEKDAVALADAMQRLREGHELSRRLGQNGRQKVIQEFNLQKSAAQLAALFESYLQN